jgi:hypothetical protein
LRLPEGYVAVHDVYTGYYLRPWVVRKRSCLRSFPLFLHTASKSVVQIVDRRKHGRAPTKCHALNVPAKCLVVHKGGTTEWVVGHNLPEPEDKKLVREID